jgi:cell wall assembly regulator SMI1
MRVQLKEISKTSIVLADFAFPETLVQQEWLGYKPATDDQIADAENRLALSLPEDYKEFLKLCNGFHAPNDVEPTFLSTDKIDYLERLDPDLTKIWTETGNIEIGAELRRSIMVAGLSEEQYFLLLPPKGNNIRWRYWKFASWIPGEQEYDDLSSYWTDVLEFNKEQVKEK